MPKTKTYENDCEKVKSMADEYLHDELIICGEFENSWELELSEEDRHFIDAHLGECAPCSDFIEEESRYVDNMMQARYAPQVSVWDFVAKQIAKNNIIIEKPPKKRFVPFGLISAAAIVLAVFIASRSGVLDIFMKSNDQSVQEVAANDAANTDMAYGIYDEADKGEVGDIMADADHIEQEAEAPAAAVSPEPEKAKEADGNVSGGMTDAQFWEANFDLAIVWLFMIDFADIGEDILQNIEIYKADPNGRFYILDIKYRDILTKNISDAGINAEAAATFNSNAENTGEKYIGILYY